MPKRILTTPENAVKNEILNFLRDKGIYHWRHNVGAVQRRGRFTRYGVNGQSDILGVLPDGKFLAIECKVTGEIPTSSQIDFLEHMNSLGAIAIVAYDLEDVILELRARGYIS